MKNLVNHIPECLTFKLKKYNHNAVFIPCLDNRDLRSLEQPITKG